MPDPAYHLRRQVADTWRICHEPSIARADALRRNLRPLVRALNKLMNRYVPARESEREAVAVYLSEKDEPAAA